MPTAILEKVFPLWSETAPTVECPACETAMNVTVETCPNCNADVTVECRACGNTIETETEACPVCGDTEYETFLLE